MSRGLAPVAVLSAALVVTGALARATVTPATPVVPGAPRVPPTACRAFVHPDTGGRYLAAGDLTPHTAVVDGNDLLALVNRSPRWVLAPEFVPADLVEVHSMQAIGAWRCQDGAHDCLRREAAEALAAMSHLLADETGEELTVHSAYRGYTLQCRVFDHVAHVEHAGFCEATVASALPGHSQHQLGTAVDVFTHSWSRTGETFRAGFGCSPGGRWLANEAWRAGFVLAYPLHPDYRVEGSECEARPDAIGRVDPRTGYKYEPWHLRFVGVDNAARYHAAWLASGPGSTNEITLEQWLRREASVSDTVDPPVCDGCACDACATFASSAVASTGADAGARGDAGAPPCGARALHLGDDGAPVPPTREPVLGDVTVTRAGWSVRVTTTVDVAGDTLTQPPIASDARGARFAVGTSFERFVPAPGLVARSYPALPGAWRLAVGLADSQQFPWRIALVDDARDTTANGWNARVPATAGRLALTVTIDGVAAGAVLRVALARGEHVGTERTVRTP